MSRTSATLHVAPLELGSRRVLIVAICLLALAIGLLYAADWALRAEHFPVRSVRFEGPFRHVARSEVEAAVLSQVRTNFFLVDLGAIKRRVEALPWVQRAAVRRAWPWDVYVQFSEQNLVGRWGNEAFVNELGEVVRVPLADVLPMPVLQGPEGTSAQVLAQYAQLRPLLTRVGLDIARLEMSPRRSWELTLSNGTVVQIDRTQTTEKLQRFLRVHREVLARAAQPPQRVDLRYSNGFAVQWSARLPASSANRATTSTAGQQAKPANKG